MKMTKNYCNQVAADATKQAQEQIYNHEEKLQLQSLFKGGDHRVGGTCAVALSNRIWHKGLSKGVFPNQDSRVSGLGTWTCLPLPARWRSCPCDVFSQTLSSL